MFLRHLPIKLSWFQKALWASLILLPSVASTAPREQDPNHVQRGGQALAAHDQPQVLSECHDWAPPGCMMKITSGTFPMGAQATDSEAANFDRSAQTDEAPVHEITVNGFWMHAYEVFAGHFDLCVQAEACKESDVNTKGGFFTYGDRSRREHPINGVTWQGAHDYCQWIGGRLPTEAEWEYAARGTDGRRFPWGNRRPRCPSSVYNNGCQTGGTGNLGGPTPGEKEAFPLLNMAGNVWEWVADWYAPNAYQKHRRNNPTGPKSGTEKVHRGGGWDNNDIRQLRSAGRAKVDPTMKLYDLGFRCVRDL